MAAVQLGHNLARSSMAVSSQPQLAYVLIEIMPTEAVAQVRMPLNISFVLDRSGSMAGEKMHCVREATMLALDRLNVQDTFSVIAFDDQLDVLVATHTAAQAHRAKANIARLADRGGTKISLGMEQALKELAHSQPNVLKRMILLTDGQTDNDEQRCLALANQARQQGVQITALGLGDDWNTQLLQDIADRSGGIADYIEAPGELVAFFQKDVISAQRAAVQNAVANLRLVVDCHPRTIWQVIPLIKNLGYQPIGERDVSVPLGELETGQGRTLLVELMVPPRSAGQFRIGQLEVRYDVPQLQLIGETVRQDVLLTFTADQRSLQQVNGPVMNIVEKVTAFKLQTQALKDAEDGNIAGATQKLRSAVTQLLNQGEHELAQTVQQEIKHLQQQGELSQAGAKTIHFTSSKTVRLKDLQ